jgi:hypothetical protein
MANTFGDVFLDMLKTHPFTSVPITFAAQTGYGFVGDMAAVIEETSVLVKYGDFTSLQQDSAITVDGTTYQIRRVENADDAHTIRLVLADA